MLSLHTNIAALNTKSNMNSTQGALSTSMTRLAPACASTPRWTTPPACRSPPVWTPKAAA